MAAGAEDEAVDADETSFGGQSHVDEGLAHLQVVQQLDEKRMVVVPPDTTQRSTSNCWFSHLLGVHDCSSDCTGILRY